MPDSNDNATTAGKWNFAGMLASAVIGSVTTLVGLHFTQQNGKQWDEDQVCFSDYKPSNSKAAEAEKFVENTNSKLYAKWNEQSAVIDYVANGMGRNEAEAKAKSEFTRFNDRPQAVKKYIENESEILLSELQDINKALNSDCMLSYKKTLKKIYDEERISR